jgi:hypothetical protein
VSFTRNLTLQTYVQPLISEARYGDYKALARSGSYDFVRYGAGAVASPEGVVVTPAGGGEAFAFPNPDFNYKSLRGNAVLRWEYRPGSVLYFVWTQTRERPFDSVGDLRVWPGMRRLFDAEANDIFLVKATCHLNL